ncbi:YbhB/YbcL family Raf kinase inhibitor-like protein [Candidatus Peregrinibacteria bacterium]|nr:YbhB/YbcL family Raf kinase inhibitor-like protein [Candidatus Peregrinibacteria bacterium]
MKIYSDSFKNNGQIPSKYTCEGENINPPLLIRDVPNNTKSLALIVDDSDAISGVWVHWIVWNIDPSTSKIEEGKSIGIEGVTSFGDNGYGGPCPPSGTHRYVFKLFALDTILDLPDTTNKNKLISEMNGHIIDTAKLTGLYSK